MKIMIINDDGYKAMGIQYLYKYLVSRGHNAYIVAPKHEKSGASSSITIHHHLEVEKIDDHTYSVDGTPVDCLKLGLSKCSGDILPDLVISGINLGPNLGTDTLYSGTVGGAMDGAVLGFPALALSTNREFGELGPGDDFDDYLDKAIEITAKCDMPKHTMLNINIPRSDIKGIKTVPIGMVVYRGDYSNLPGEELKYRLTAFRDDKFNTSNEVDDRYFYENYMTVTPLTFDLTDHSLINMVRACAEG